MSGMPAEPTVLLPVATFFPGRSPRWIADACRAGRIPGAIKIGRIWMMRPADVDALVAGRSGTRVPTADEVASTLRAHGLDTRAA